MSKEKQIEEMAEAICGLNTSDGCFCDGGYCNYNCLSYEKAEVLYNAGYRKQSEWVSVDERLPEESDCYLVNIINHFGLDFVIFTYYTKGYGWGVPDVTHWMPLPAPPTVKEN